MARDNVELPAILEKCCTAIEKHGLQSQGIYRISGMARKVASLKERLDKGSYLSALCDPGVLRLSISADIDSVNLDSEEWISDINNVTSVLKMWFRELPDPLLTSTLHQGFVEAASKSYMLCKYGNFSQEFQKSRTIACGTYVYTSELTTYRTRTTLHSNIFWGTCTSVSTLVVIYLH